MFPANSSTRKLACGKALRRTSITSVAILSAMRKGNAEERTSTSGKGQSEDKPFPSSAQLALRQHKTPRRLTACPCSSVALASLRGWRRENIWPPPLLQEQ